MIERVLSTPSTRGAENLRAWQHMTLAGLYPGAYKGKDAIGANYQIDKGDTPFSPLNGGDKLAYAFWTGAGLPSTPSIPLYLARPQVESGTNQGKPTEPALSGPQALVIDTKIDDADPSSGAMIGLSGFLVNGTGPASSSHACVPSTHNYDTLYPKELNCIIYYSIKR